VADYGADEAYPNAELDGKLPALLARGQRLFHVLGRDPKLDGRLVEILEMMRLRSRQGFVPAAEIIDPRRVLHEMRLRKEPAELEIMRRAAAISAEAHRDAARLADEGRTEYELEAALLHAFRRRGAAGPAYSSIVGGGRNATVLHYIRNDQKLAAGELVLIDAGCELEGYASDVTRTYPVGGAYQGAQRAVYEVVLEANLAALALAKPGATLPQIHQAATRRLVEGMVELGLLSGPPDELIKSEAHRRFYMHNTSHWLGLDVHDVGAYAVAGKPRVLEPGMVFTIEPGLYVAADDAQAPAEIRGIGVRIEDDVAITAGGCENLTAAIPKHPADVESWLRE